MRKGNAVSERVDFVKVLVEARFARPEQPCRLAQMKGSINLPLKPASV